MSELNNAKYAFDNAIKLLNDNNLKESIEQLEEILKIHPNHKTSLSLLSDIYIKLNKPNESLNYVNKVLTIDKTDKNILEKKKIVFNEKSKNLKTVSSIVKVLEKNNFSRNDSLISVGGGICGDVCGFASSIFKRGLNFINVPTTLLSQVDSAIGGKTGINSLSGKNMIGSFYQPSLVISDINFLKSLPKKEMICGYAEILKHSLIKNKIFF